MSSRIYESLINQARSAIEQPFGIIDETGTIVACSDEIRIGQKIENIEEILSKRENIFVLKNTTYQKIIRNNKVEFITFISESNEITRRLLLLFTSNVDNVKAAYSEKYDKLNFIKSVITDNILPGDIIVRAKELHLTTNVNRVVFLIKIEKLCDVYPSEILQGLFPNKARDFIVVLDDETAVLIKELKNGDDIKEVNAISNRILNTFASDLSIKIKVGVGTLVDNVKDISRSYKEAQMALLIGGIFENNKSIITYNNLGIGRLIYQLPITLCRLFLKEVFKSGSFDSFDEEITLTIDKFFENNLNVSETSRQLFVHRNTLVYRLDKIQKQSGLDLRMFDDAITFKVAMLVKKYLEKADEIY